MDLSALSQIKDSMLHAAAGMGIGVRGELITWVRMPVIVIGADTPVGDAVMETVVPAAAEVRAFISEEGIAEELRRRGVKVALGDVSDFSHVEAAALNCFCAILVVDAVGDGRSVAFAKDSTAVVDGWAEAIRNAGLHRTIWVSSSDAGRPFPSPTPEVATVLVHGDVDKAAREVARLEGLLTIPSR